MKKYTDSRIILNTISEYNWKKLEVAEFYKLNNDPVIEILQRNQRNTTKKVTDYKPFLH